MAANRLQIGCKNIVKYLIIINLFNFQVLMRTTSSISFGCRPSKTDKKGLSPIEITVTINSDRFTFNLPRKEYPAVFKRDMSRRKSDLFQYCEGVRTEVSSIQTDLIRHGIPVTAQTLKAYIKNGGIKSYTVRDLVSEYLQGVRVRSSVRTYRKHELIYDRFISFMGERELSTIVPADIQRFYDSLRSEMRDSTTGGMMTKLKALFRYAFDNNIMTVFPFNGIKITKGQPDIEYLNEKELERIRKKELHCERLDRVRDLFLMQVATGLSYADLSSPFNMSERNGVHYIKGRRVKTGVEFTAVVLPEGVAIYNKYRGELPIVTNQKMNAYLKEISDICNVKPIKTHMGRRTYATMALSKGVAITTVSKMLGHRNTNITQKHYAKVCDDTVLNDAVKML